MRTIRYVALQRTCAITPTSSAALDSARGCFAFLQSKQLVEEYTEAILGNYKLDYKQKKHMLRMLGHYSNLVMTNSQA